jgi:hypothetical protein
MSWAAVLVAGVAVLFTAGCPASVERRSDSPPDSTASSAASPNSPAPAGSSQTAVEPAGGSSRGPGTTPAGGRDDPVTFRTAYPWGVPTEPVLISHPVRPPVASPPAPPLPWLVAINAADHGGQRPPYSRISFYFRGGFPSYELGYVDRVRAEGTGDTVELPGNAFLRIRFIQAQAHDERGRWTVTDSPDPALRFPTLRGYGFGGDFEGYLTYGLGLRVAAGSDQVLRVRVLELTRTDGRHVIAFDVRHG